VRVEEKLQRKKYFNGVVRVKQARLKDYQPFYGSDGELSSEVEEETDSKVEHQESKSRNDDGFSQVNDEDLFDAEQFGNQFEKMQKKMMSMKNLRQFLQGI